MQFKNIIAFVSLAVMASAAPAENLVERTTPGQAVQNQCSQGQTAKCCNSLQKAVANLIPIQIGLNCVSLDRVFYYPFFRILWLTISQCSVSFPLATNALRARLSHAAHLANRFVLHSFAHFHTDPRTDWPRQHRQRLRARLLVDAFG